MYDPWLSHCYGCLKELQQGDQIIGFYEHYMHVDCAPVYLVETKRIFTYRKVQMSDPWDAEFENVPGIDPGVKPRHGRTCNSSNPEIGCECGLADWQADHPELDTGWDTPCGYCGKHPTHGPSHPGADCHYEPTPLAQILRNGGVVVFDEVDLDEPF